MERRKGRKVGRKGWEKGEEKEREERPGSGRERRGRKT